MHFRSANGDIGVVLGNGGTYSFPLHIDNQSSVVTRTAVTLGASYSDAATFEVALNQSTQVFVQVYFAGVDGLTSLDCRIEFYDPDWGVWFPSKGYDSSNHVNRVDATGDYDWAIATPTEGLGHILTSNEEHRHFNKFRARFKGAGTLTADDLVLVNWFHSGGKSNLRYTS